MNAVLVRARGGLLELRGLRDRAAYSSSITLLTEAALLFVAAQAGFLDGPARDGQHGRRLVVPAPFLRAVRPPHDAQRRAAHGRRRGVAMVLRGGTVSQLVVMYAINVFLTFSLSNLGMSRLCIARAGHATRSGSASSALHGGRGVLCVTDPGSHDRREVRRGRLGHARRHARAHRCSASWSSATTGSSCARSAGSTGSCPDRRISSPRAEAPSWPRRMPGEIDPKKPVAILFVGGYGGLGRHALLTCLRMFPGHFRGVVFVSIAVVDTGAFKGGDEVEALVERTRRASPPTSGSRRPRARRRRAPTRSGPKSRRRR